MSCEFIPQQMYQSHVATASFTPVELISVLRHYPEKTAIFFLMLCIPQYYVVTFNY